MKFLLITLYAVLSSFSSAFAENGDVRIQSLLPIFLLDPLAVEPAIPSNFVSISPGGEFGDWTYWGSPEVLEAFVKDRKTLSQPLIRVTLGNIAQTGYNTFNESSKNFKKTIKDLGGSHFKDKRFMWGTYPVWSISYDIKGVQTPTLMAYVGLNSESVSVLLFNVLWPTDKPNIQEGLALWNNFLNQTKQLSDPDCYQNLPHKSLNLNSDA